METEDQFQPWPEKFKFAIFWGKALSLKLQYKSHRAKEEAWKQRERNITVQSLEVLNIYQPVGIIVKGT